MPLYCQNCELDKPLFFVTYLALCILLQYVPINLFHTLTFFWHHYIQICNYIFLCANFITIVMLSARL